MTNEAKKRLLDVVSAKRLTIGVSVTLNSIDSYDLDLTRECVEPIDDAGGRSEDSLPDKRDHSPDEFERLVSAKDLRSVAIKSNAPRDARSAVSCQFPPAPTGEGQIANDSFTLFVREVPVRFSRIFRNSGSAGQ